MFCLYLSVWYTLVLVREDFVCIYVYKGIAYFSFGKGGLYRYRCIHAGIP